MRVGPYNVDPASQYNGPEFDEYCISEGKYLPATRDRSACVACPLGDLCQPGFEEQVRRVIAGMHPSLTDGCSITLDALSRDALLRGLTPTQQAFVISKIPGLSV
jgi:hypothetical protein